MYGDDKIDWYYDLEKEDKNGILLKKDMSGW